MWGLHGLCEHCSLSLQPGQGPIIPQHIFNVMGNTGLQAEGALPKLAEQCSTLVSLWASRPEEHQGPATHRSLTPEGSRMWAVGPRPRLPVLQTKAGILPLLLCDIETLQAPVSSSVK